MSAYMCDTCRHAKPAKRDYWQTSDGSEWTDRREYVRYDVRRPLWTVEKRTECWDYEKKGGKR